MTVAVCVVVLLFSGNAFSQRLQDGSNGVLTATVNFGALTPGVSNTPSATTVSYRIRSNHVNGYRLRVVAATFNPALTAGADGGMTISASDIGVGLTSVALAPGFTGITPRADVITSGLNYNPSHVTAANGLTPFAGLASGQATLQDLIDNPNLTILSGNRIHPNQLAAGAANFLTITLTFGVVRQYFTPATFTATLTLEIVDGP
jgi:hypothetical protein